MAESLFMGLDGGASKTECAIGRPDGFEPIVARGGPSNHEGIGYEAVARNVAEVVQRALDSAGVIATDIRGACFAMGGMDLPPDRDDIRHHAVDPLGLECPILICNDAYAGFMAGSPQGIGVCFSYGSGVTYCGRNDEGDDMQFERPRPAPLEPRIWEALFAEYQGVGPVCGFKEAYLAALGLETLKDFLWSHYSRTRSYVPKVDASKFRSARESLFDPAFHNDPVLCHVFGHYADDTADILIGMAQKLRLEGKHFDLVLSGSVLTKGRHPALTGRIADRFVTRFSTCTPIVVDGPPAKGALRLAAELA